MEVMCTPCFDKQINESGVGVVDGWKVKVPSDKCRERRGRRKKAT